MAAGRRVYAIGGNELASTFSGIRVNRVKLSVFIFSGLRRASRRCCPSLLPARATSATPGI